MVGVLVLTRANKVDRQVGPDNSTKSQSRHQIETSNQGQKVTLPGLSSATRL